MEKYPSTFIACLIITGVGLVSGCDQIFERVDCQNAINKIIREPRNVSGCEYDGQYSCTVHMNIGDVKEGGQVVLEWETDTIILLCNLNYSRVAVGPTAVSERMATPYEPRLTIEYCTKNGSLASTSFEFYFGLPKFELLTNNSRNAVLKYNGDNFHKPTSVEDLRLVLIPNRDKESYWINISTQTIHLENLVPNYRYDLKARIERTGAAANGLPVWSWWNEIHFTTATENATILGYDAEAVYIAHNQWSRVLDPNMTYARTAEKGLDCDTNTPRCMAAVGDADGVAVSWDARASELCTLRLIWSLSRDGKVRFANSTDIGLAVGSYFIPLSKSVDSSHLKVGYSLISSEYEYTGIKWINVTFFRDKVLVVNRIHNITVKDTSTNEKTIIWQASDRKGKHLKNLLTGWSIEMDTRVFKVTPEFRGNRYQFHLTGLTECQNYTSKIIWESSVKSCPFYVNTIPAFKADIRRAHATGTQISFDWTLPNCTYDTSAEIKLFVNNTLRTAITDHRYDHYTLNGDLQQVHHLRLESCYRNVFHNSELSFNPQMSDQDIVDKSIVDLGPNWYNTKMTVSCPLQGMEHAEYIYVVRDKTGKVVKEITENNKCSFVDYCDYRDGFNISLKGKCNNSLLFDIQEFRGPYKCPSRIHVIFIGIFGCLMFVIGLYFSIGMFKVVLRFHKARKTKKRLKDIRKIILPDDLNILPLTPWTIGHERHSDASQIELMTKATPNQKT